MSLESRWKSGFSPECEMIVDRRRPVLTGIDTGDCWVILAGVSDMIVP